MVDTDQADAIVERRCLTDLSDHAYKLIYRYSNGMKGKWCIGLTIVGNPPLPFHDELTVAIDPTAHRMIL